MNINQIKFVATVLTFILLANLSLFSMDKPLAAPSKAIAMSKKDANLYLYGSATADDINGMTKALEAGADIDAIVYTSTALYAAVYARHENAVQFLLDAGARFDIPNTGKVIALDAALTYPKPTIIRALILAGAWFTEEREKGTYFEQTLTSAFEGYPLEFAVLKGSITDVQILIASGSNVVRALQLIENHRLNNSRLYQRMHMQSGRIKAMLVEALEGQYMQFMQPGPGQQQSLFLHLLPADLRRALIRSLIFSHSVIPTLEKAN